MFTTHPKLLAEVQNGDNASWIKFRDLYRPLIFHCAEKFKVRPADFLELEQDVLVTFWKACEKFKYNPTKGKFRTYLGAVIKSCIIKYFKNIPDNKLLNITEHYSIGDYFENNWDKEWELHILNLAVQSAKEKFTKTIFAAFELCDLQNIDPKVVAISLKVSVATVYNHRKKVLVYLQEYVKQSNGTEDLLYETL